MALVSVELDEFSDAEILEAAIDIIHRINESGSSHRREELRETADMFRAELLGAASDPPDMPPPSTAAKIRTEAEYRKFLETGTLP